MLNRSTFYCDESGNTGFNLSNNEQPFYVTGGVLVPRAAHPHLAGTLALTRPASGGERKATELLKKPEGRQAMCSMLDRAFGLGCHPFFLISEKRFNIAQKVVDVLFDPAHNEVAAWLKLADDLARDRIENQFFLLGKELDGFLDAYRDPSVEGWKEAITTLQLACRERGWSQLDVTLGGALKNSDLIFEREHQAGLDLVGGGLSYHYHFASIQVPMFLHVVRLVDGVLEDAGARGTVCHDETPKFERAFQTAFNWIKGTTGESAQWTSGVCRRLGITQLDSLVFANSETSEGLQLSDMLVGLVRWALVERPRQRAGALRLPGMVYQLLALLIGDSPTHARIVLSDRGKERLMDIVVPELIRRQSPSPVFR